MLYGTDEFFNHRRSDFSDDFFKYFRHLQKNFKIAPASLQKFLKY